MHNYHTYIFDDDDADDDDDDDTLWIVLSGFGLLAHFIMQKNIKMTVKALFIFNFSLLIKERNDL